MGGDPKVYVYETKDMTYCEVREKDIVEWSERMDTVYSVVSTYVMVGLYRNPINNDAQYHCNGYLITALRKIS